MADKRKTKDWKVPVKKPKTQTVTVKDSPVPGGSQPLAAGSFPMMERLTSNWKSQPDKPKKKHSLIDDEVWLDSLDTTSADTLAEDLIEEGNDDSDKDSTYTDSMDQMEEVRSSQSSDDDIFGFKKKSKRGSKAKQTKLKKSSSSSSNNKENVEPDQSSQEADGLDLDSQELVEVMRRVVMVMQDKEVGIENIPFPSDIIRPLVEEERMSQKSWTSFTCKGFRMKKMVKDLIKEYRTSGKLISKVEKKLKLEGPKLHVKMLLKDLVETDDKFRNNPKSKTKEIGGGVTDAGDQYNGTVKVPKDKSLIGGIQSRALATSELEAHGMEDREDREDTQASGEDKRVQFELEVARRNRPRKSSVSSSSKGSLDALVSLSAEQSECSKQRFESLQASKLARHKDTLALKQETNLLMAKLLRPKVDNMKMINIIGGSRKLAYSLKLDDIGSVVEEVKKYMKITDKDIDGVLRCYGSGPLTIVTDPNCLHTMSPEVKVKFTEISGEGKYLQFCCDCCCDNINTQ